MNPCVRSPAVWHTIDQAAAVQGVTARTIRKWIKDGDLPVITSPILPGVTYIDDRALLAASAAVAARRKTTTSYSTNITAGGCG